MLANFRRHVFQIYTEINPNSAYFRRDLDKNPKCKSFNKTFENYIHQIVKTVNLFFGVKKKQNKKKLSFSKPQTECKKCTDALHKTTFTNSIIHIYIYYCIYI